MIHYQRGGRWHIINLFFMKGSLFPKSFMVAAPCAIVTFFLKYYEVFTSEKVLLDNSAWNGFSFLVGFLVVFRTSEAYSRFWGGCTATHQMRAEWMDAASAIVAFCKHSKAPPEDIKQFKHLAIRLFSILHAMALGEIEECEDIEEVMAFDLELIDPIGIDKDSWRALVQCRNKVTLVFTWLQSVIVENINNGLLTIPPPILSRVFQELANGMVALHEAQKIATVPFPFPYAQTCDALLIMHWMITPLITAQYAANWMWGMVFSFIQVFILWSLNNIAVEIEHPFGGDANDLDAAHMQTDMNMNLLLLLHPVTTRSPTLSKKAQIEGLVNMGREASMSMKAATTFKEMAVEAMRESCVKDFWHRDVRDVPYGPHPSSWQQSPQSPRQPAELPIPVAPTAGPARINPGCSPPPPNHSQGDMWPEPPPPELPPWTNGDGRHEGAHPAGYVEDAQHNSFEPPGEPSPAATQGSASGVGNRFRRTPAPPNFKMGQPTPSSSSRLPRSPTPAAPSAPASAWRRESEGAGSLPQATADAMQRQQRDSQGGKPRSPRREAERGQDLDLEGGGRARGQLDADAEWLSSTDAI